MRSPGRAAVSAAKQTRRFLRALDARAAAQPVRTAPPVPRRKPVPVFAPKPVQRPSGRRSLARLALALALWAVVFGGGGVVLLTHHRDSAPAAPVTTSTPAAPTVAGAGAVTCFPLQPC